MTWISRIWKVFRKIFSVDIADRIVGGVNAVSQYLPEIYQVVRRLAELTPNRTDDELIAAADRLGVSTAVGGLDYGEALARIAVAWARKKWPDAPERRIRRAIEIAYGAIRP